MQYSCPKEGISSISHHKEHARCLHHSPRALYSSYSTCMQKSPNQNHEQIEKTLQEMVDLQVITPVTECMKWVSSLTYPCKPNGTLCICLDPHDLNSAIIWKTKKPLPRMKPPTSSAALQKTPKLDMKDGFWSIYLDTLSSYLTIFNSHKGCMPFGLCVPRCIPNVHGSQH